MASARKLFPDLYDPHQARKIEKEAVQLLSSIHYTPLQDRREIVNQGVKRSRLCRVRVDTALDSIMKDKSALRDQGGVEFLKYRRKLFASEPSADEVEAPETTSSEIAEPISPPGVYKQTRESPRMSGLISPTQPTISPRITLPRSPVSVERNEQRVGGKPKEFSKLREIELSPENDGTRRLTRAMSARLTAPKPEEPRFDEAQSANIVQSNLDSANMLAIMPLGDEQITPYLPPPSFNLNAWNAQV